MSRVQWVILVAVSGLIVVALAVFAASEVPPCFGVVPTGEVTPECLAAWRVTRPVQNLIGTPVGAVILFSALVVGTRLAVGLANRRRRSPGRDSVAR